MQRTFNTAGPCVPGEHFLVSPRRRVQRVMRLVRERKYFTLHAGRRTGKTTSLRWLVEHFNSGGDYAAACVDLRTAQGLPAIARALAEVLHAIDRAVERQLPAVARPTLDEVSSLLEHPETSLLEYLSRISDATPEPLVVFFDGADGLVGEASTSFLTQVCAGHASRSLRPFPHSLALVGTRRARASSPTRDGRRGHEGLGASSPIQFSAAACTLEPFHGEEVVDLLSQYADEAAIAFSPEASRRIQDTTEGHPLLVNAIAQRLVGDDFEGRPAEVGVEHVDRAVGDLIAGRSVLDDQPAAGVDDPRVGRVLDRMVAGAHLPVDRSEEALERAIGLGLLRVERCTARIANPLFREAILRVWTRAIRARPRRSTAANAGPRGTVDVRAILEEFQAVWRLDGHRMATDLPAQKARPHVILFAFLHHALPEGARIESDYGFGRDGVQFDVTWRERTYAIESKVSRAPNESVALLGRSAGRQRTSGECEHWLVLFDLRRDLDWEQKHYLRTERVGDRSVHVVGV